MKKIIVRIVCFLCIWLLMDWGVATFFQKGLERYYGLDQEADILLIGHSHMMKSCNKVRMEEALGCKVSKYCREGVMVRDRFSMVQHFLDTQQDGSVPFVLYGVDPFMFNEGDLSLNSYKLFYPFMDSAPMDRLIRAEASSWYDYPLHKYIRCTRITENMMYRSLRGWFRYWKSFQNGIIPDERWKLTYHLPAGFPEPTVKLFHDTVDLLVKRGCHVVLVHPPIIEGYRKGSPEKFARMKAYFRKMADESPHIDFLDYCPGFDHCQHLFEDPVHVNREGERQMTELLIRDMRRLMDK